MYNQKHTWDEQLPVVKFVHAVFQSTALYYWDKKIRRKQLCEMSKGQNPPLRAAPPILNLQFIFPWVYLMRLFGQVSTDGLLTHQHTPPKLALGFQSIVFASDTLARLPVVRGVALLITYKGLVLSDSSLSRLKQFPHLIW